MAPQIRGGGDRKGSVRSVVAGGAERECRKRALNRCRDADIELPTRLDEGGRRGRSRGERD